MINFEVNKRPQILDICSALIDEKKLLLDRLERKKLEALVITLINLLS